MTYLVKTTLGSFVIQATCPEAAELEIEDSGAGSAITVTPLDDGR